jgi:tetratricopeptide (TPR) repeat protein
MRMERRKRHHFALYQNQNGQVLHSAQAMLSLIEKTFYPPSNYTFYNPYTSGSRASEIHWKNFHNDATLAKYNADCVGGFIGKASHEQIAALDKATEKMRGTMAQGFSAVADHLSGIKQAQERENRLLELCNQEAEKTNARLAIIDQRMELMVERQRVTNVLQENIAELLRIPDSQKQRQLHIELGLKFIKHADRDSDLYKDAIKELLAAEQLLSGDYFVLREIGMLYLYAIPVLDLEKAAAYLVRAGKYASVESFDDSARLSNVLTKTISLRFADQADPKAKDISVFAADAYSNAALTYYIRGQHQEAIKYADKALSLNPESDRLRFLKAKYLAASGNASKAYTVLKAVEPTAEMIQTAISDLDLAREVVAKWLPYAQVKKQELEKKRAAVIVAAKKKVEAERASKKAAAEKAAAQRAAKRAAAKQAVAEKAAEKAAKKAARKAAKAANAAEKAVREKKWEEGWSLMREAMEAMKYESDKFFWQKKDYAKARELLLRAAELEIDQAKAELAKLPQ